MNPSTPVHDGVCPVTHRCFSAGQPDGVWVISILCTFAVVAALLFAAGRTLMLTFAGATVETEGLTAATLQMELLKTWIPVIAIVALYGPLALFLLLRKAVAVAWTLLLLVLCAAACGVLAVGFFRSRSLDYIRIGALLLPVVAHAWAMTYVKGLKKDALLG
ncbi:hypothetical protein OPIT5_00800 [Opitutaceae bacterium TAV5]|nr:hypothetical protein OPIT5_00800 [Opitutaceae bacterium TAV5]